VKLVDFGRIELSCEHPHVDIDDEDASHRATASAATGHGRIAVLDPPHDVCVSE